MDSIVNVENSGWSNYESFTATREQAPLERSPIRIQLQSRQESFQRRWMGSDVFVGEGGGQTSDYYNPGLDYGRVPFTRNNRVIANFLYQTSSNTTNKFLNQLYSGWEIAGRMLFQTGPYLTVTAPGTDPSGTNFDNSYDGGDPRADIVSGAPIYPTNKSIYNWVNPAAFASAAGQYRPLRKLTGRRRCRPGDTGSFALHLSQLHLQRALRHTNWRLGDESLQPPELWRPQFKPWHSGIRDDRKLAKRRGHRTARDSTRRPDHVLARCRV